MAVYAFAFEVTRPLLVGLVGSGIYSSIAYGMLPSVVPTACENNQTTASSSLTSFTVRGHLRRGVHFIPDKQIENRKDVLAR